MVGSVPLKDDMPMVELIRDRDRSYELNQTFRSFEGTPKNMKENMLFVAFDNSKITESGPRDRYAAHWQSVESTPVRLEKVGMPTKALKAAARYVLLIRSQDIHDASISTRWNPKDPESLIAWLRGKLGLTSRS